MATGRRLIGSGSPFEAAIGYSRAVVAGDWVFVSGTTGFDYATLSISGDVGEQANAPVEKLDAEGGAAGPATMADAVAEGEGARA